MEMAQLFDLRARVLRGEEVSDKELADAIVALRSGRSSVGSTKAAKEAAKPKIVISLADLMKPAGKPATPVTSDTPATPAP